MEEGSRDNSDIRLRFEDYFKVPLIIILTLMFSANLGFIHLFNKSINLYRLIVQYQKLTLEFMLSSRSEEAWMWTRMPRYWVVTLRVYSGCQNHCLEVICAFLTLITVGEPCYRGNYSLLWQVTGNFVSCKGQGQGSLPDGLPNRELTEDLDVNVLWPSV